MLVMLNLSHHFINLIVIVACFIHPEATYCCMPAAETQAKPDPITSECGYGYGFHSDSRISVVSKWSSIGVRYRVVQYFIKMGLDNILILTIELILTMRYLETIQQCISIHFFIETLSEQGLYYKVGS